MKKATNLAVTDLINNRRKLISTTELAEMLRPFLAPSTVSQYLHAGKLPFNAVKIGRRLYVSKIQAENYLAKRMNELNAAEIVAETVTNETK